VKPIAILEERLALMAPARRLRLANAERIAARYAGGRAVRVLDAGCGDGLLTLALAKRHPGWSFVGVDIDAKLLEGARARALARQLGNVEFVTADLTAKLPAGEFDIVLALECLGEIPDDAAALQALADAAAPGALLVAQVPDSEWGPILPGSPPTWRHAARHGYDTAGLRTALGEAGFDKATVEPTFNAVAMAAQEVRDRIKGSPLALRALAFPFMLAAVRLELWGVRLGRPNALLACAWLEAGR
jgi:trans-aconitate methyltransferase